MLTDEERRARLRCIHTVLDKLTYPTDNPSGLVELCRLLLSEVERLEKELEEYRAEEREQEAYCAR